MGFLRLCIYGPRCAPTIKSVIHLVTSVDNRKIVSLVEDEIKNDCQSLFPKVKLRGWDFNKIKSTNSKASANCAATPSGPVSTPIQRHNFSLCCHGNHIFPNCASLKTIPEISDFPRSRHQTRIAHQLCNSSAAEHKNSFWPKKKTENKRKCIIKNQNQKMC